MTEDKKMVPVTIPIPGKITKVNIKAGDKINKDDLMIVFESMKMELNILAPVAGMVKDISVTPGQLAQANTVVVNIEQSA